MIATTPWLVLRLRPCDTSLARRGLRAEDVACLSCDAMLADYGVLPVCSVYWHHNGNCGVHIGIRRSTKMSNVNFKLGYTNLSPTWGLVVSLRPFVSTVPHGMAGWIHSRISGFRIQCDQGVWFAIMIRVGIFLIRVGMFQNPFRYQLSLSWESITWASTPYVYSNTVLPKGHQLGKKECCFKRISVYIFGGLKQQKEYSFQPGDSLAGWYVQRLLHLWIPSCKSTGLPNAMVRRSLQQWHGVECFTSHSHPDAPIDCTNYWPYRNQWYVPVMTGSLSLMETRQKSVERPLASNVTS